MLVKNINKRIQETLKARERALARRGKGALDESQNKDVPTYEDLASRTTFVRMISNRTNPKSTTQIIQGGSLKKTILAEGTNSVGLRLATRFGLDAYLESENDSGIFEGIRPISGLNDISVEYTGGYNAIRKATINWNVNSLERLEALTPHFLSVGKTILLDWGWVYKRPELNYYTTFFENTSEEDYLINPDAFNDPMPLIYEAGGNYDAIGGVISNFEYKLREDGGFDCVTNLTSIGISIFKSYQVDKASNEFGISINDDGTKNQIQTDSIINAVLNLDSILDNQLVYSGETRNNDGEFTSAPQGAVENARSVNQSTVSTSDSVGNNGASVQG